MPCLKDDLGALQWCYCCLSEAPSQSSCYEFPENMQRQMNASQPAVELKLLLLVSCCAGYSQALNAWKPAAERKLQGSPLRMWEGFAAFFAGRWPRLPRPSCCFCCCHAAAASCALLALLCTAQPFVTTRSVQVECLRSSGTSPPARSRLPRYVEERSREAASRHALLSYMFSCNQMNMCCYRRIEGSSIYQRQQLSRQQQASLLTVSIILPSVITICSAREIRCVST